MSFNFECLLLLFKHLMDWLLYVTLQFLNSLREQKIEVGVWRLGVPRQQTRSSRCLLPQAHLAPVFLTLECACESPRVLVKCASWLRSSGAGVGGSVEKILGLVGKGAVINECLLL